MLSTSTVPNRVYINRRGGKYGRNRFYCTKETWFSTEIFAGAIVSVFQYLAPLQYPAKRAKTPINMAHLLGIEHIEDLLVDFIPEWLHI
jgi:hypothetical protein